MDFYENVYYYFGQPPTILVFGLVFMLLVALFEKILSSFKLSLPRKLNLAIFATIITLALTGEQGRLLERTTPNNPEVLLDLIHPFLILRVTYDMDTRVILRAMPHILFLSTFGVGIFTALMGGAVFLWSNMSLMFMPLYGLSIASIDNPEFSRYVQEFEHMKHAMVILQGEFIFGATTTILGLELVLGFKYRFHYWYEVILFIFVRIFGALILGYIFGKLSSYALTKTPESTNVAILFLNCVFLTYFISANFLNISATLTTFIVAFMMTRQRSKIYKELDVVVNSILEAVFNIVECFGYLVVWIILLSDTLEYFQIDMLIEYVVVYLTSIIIRFITLLIIYPLFVHLGHNWSIKPFIVLFWLTKRGILQMLIFHVICTYAQDYLPELNTFKPHTLILTCLHLVINGALGSFVLRIFGITTLSAEKMLNVNNCVKILNIEKDRYLSIMKLNRFYMDAKWSDFENELTLKNHAKLDGVDENTYFGQARESHCDECNKDIIMEPSKKEFKLISMAAKLRVLQSTKISYVRQQEKGMLSKSSLKILLKLVEQTRDANADYFIDIEIIKSMFRRTGWPEKCRDIILTYVHSTKRFKLPRKPFRRWCYRIVLHKYYELTIYLFVILLFMMDILAIFCFVSVHLLVKLVCILILSCDMVMKINAYSHIYLSDGVRIHFSDLWNTFDLILLIMTFLEIIPHILGVDRADMAAEGLEHMIYMFIQCTFTAFIVVKMLRILKLIVLLFHFRDEMVQFCNKYINNRIMIAFEIAKAVVVAYNEALHHISLYTYNDIAKRQVVVRLKEDIITVFREIDFAQMTNPTACMTIKTRYAISVVLNYLWKEIESLKSSGFIDDFEYEKIKEGMEKCNIKALVQMKKIRQNSMEDAFYELPWLHYFYELAELMFANSVVRTFKAKQLIHEAQTLLPGIYVIIEGIVAMTFNPIVRVKMPSTGMIPRRDYVDYRYQDKTSKHLIPGNSMGEFAVLSDCTYDAELTAVTNVTLLMIPSYMANQVFNIGHDMLGVPSYIWKYLAYNIVVDILWDVPIYKSFSREDLMVYVNKGFIPKTGNRNMFIASGLIEDMILFEGQIEDLNSGDTYVAPSYLPRNVQKLQYINNEAVPVKLFIIPLKRAYIKTIVDNSQAADFDVTKLRLLEGRRNDEPTAHRRSNRISVTGKRFSTDRKSH